MKPLWKIDPTTPLGSPFEPGAHHDVVVVGAGLTGLSTAVMLTRAGLDVAVVDAGRVAELSTGGNTGKLSLLQGQTLAKIRAQHPASLVQAYVDANRAGMDWLTAFADTAGVPYTWRTDHTYAQTAEGVDTVRSQHDAAREAGLPTRMLAPADLPTAPFPIVGAVALDDQVTIDPVAVAQALARELLTGGGTLHTGVRVTGAHALGESRVDTAAGPLFADHIVLATGTPILDRGLYFSKVRGSRSYCVSFRVPGDVLEGTFLSVDSPSRSIRPVSAADGPAGTAQLIVGGNGHPVGRSDSETAAVEDLVAWTTQHFPGAQETHRWSAQDYESHNLIPFVGALPRGLGVIRVATGYAKWGLSNAPGAALRITSEILGTDRRDRASWMTALGTRMTRPSDIARAATEGAKVAAAAVSGWVDAETRAVPVERPAEGSGVVAQRAGHPVGISTVDGITRAVSAVCTHLGGVLDWNDAECTWDCPLHASRFAPDGTRIEGPAVRNLENLPRTGD
ncbi:MULTISPECIES: FAD-dependent oxidoreductase [unclassified Microbacterium]|uniref:FAD-dependent oxidoreductase n=1 Tax=unclassified Microbacterium TaxID=2609290 RepID=UPI000EA99757|nr:MULTISPECIES: FAD-dependent oxidoreductase [unclassified Microbacterium]MBT2484486.1 FAD-dependent oxidoreductase [Microbacterium sp. ISL-108]RKN67392.1 FAD-dependent oxidoreductase [Microbacterium sp. CGR2]